MRSNINKERYNRVSMKNLKERLMKFSRIRENSISSRFRKWWDERVENANKIAFDITSSNQEAMEKILNIGKKKK